MKQYLNTFFILVLLGLTGCDESEKSRALHVERGTHFQGRDCLGCHNFDLKPDKHLRVATTLFKSPTPSDIDNLDETCNVDAAIEFIDSDSNLIYSTAEYYDVNSAGNRGQGNIFLLDRLFDSTLNGNYTIQIVERTTGMLLAKSSSNTHSFNGNDYSLSNPANDENRLSCNACHNIGRTSYLYVQFNTNLCN